MTLIAKTSLILLKNKAGFPREGHIFILFLDQLFTNQSTIGISVKNNDRMNGKSTQSLFKSSPIDVGDKYLFIYIGFQNGLKALRHQ